MNWRALAVFFHDLAVVAVAWAVAYLGRYNFDFQAVPWGSVLRILMVVLPLYGVVFVAGRLYRGLWRYASLPDMRQILVAVAVATLATPLLLLMLRLDVVLPRSVILLAPSFVLLLMCGSRLAYRMWREGKLLRITAEEGAPVIVLGAGDAAANLLKELAKSRHWRAVAILDDDASKRGRLIHGVRVAGVIAEFPRVAHRFGTRKAVLAMPSVPTEARRHIIDYCVENGAEMMVVPAFEQLLRGNAQADVIRPVRVEDLLGRDPVQLDAAGLNQFLTGRVVMVTGAGGSIGSELCRQIQRFGPRSLLCVDSSEYALYRLKEELDGNPSGVELVAAIGDVKNRLRIDQLMERHAPSVVFHAAAYKHVPLMEDLNAWEAIQNNVHGTHVVASAAKRHGVDKFVLVSTDKAVNPTNVMGASKRLAEIVCQSLSEPGSTLFSVVRFGNVLGSAGSVIPKFQEQIAKGGPVTVTHPDIIRYFMSIPEAAQLVLQAGCMGRGGEIFVLDMGEPVRIAELARTMIRLSGFSEEDIQIRFTGLRPGEKLFEELLADDETTMPTPHPKVRVAKVRPAAPEAFNEILQWIGRKQPLDADEVKRDLRRWVAEYQSTPRPRLVSSNERLDVA